MAALRHGIARATIVLALIFLLPAVALLGQSIRDIGPGARVRVTAPTLGYRGVVAVVLTRDSQAFILNRLEQKDTVAVAFDQITALDFSAERHGHMLAGLGIGAVGGALLGVVLGYAEGDDKCVCDPEALFCLNCLGATTASEKARFGAATLGLAGGIVGAIAGGSTKSDRWQPVLIPTRTIVGLGKAAAGVGLRIGLRVTF